MPSARQLPPSVEEALEFILAREGYPTLRAAAFMSPSELDWLLENGDADQRNGRTDALLMLGDAEVIRRAKAERGSFREEAKRYLAKLSRLEMLAFGNAPAWTSEQAIALAFGLRPLPGFLLWLSRNWTLEERLNRIMELRRLATDAGILGGSVRPVEFLNWASALTPDSVDLPPTLLTAVKRREPLATLPQRLPAAQSYSTASQLAKRLGFHRNTIARMEKRGDLPPAIWFGREKRYRDSEVELAVGRIERRQGRSPVGDA